MTENLLSLLLSAAIATSQAAAGIPESDLSCETENCCIPPAAKTEGDVIFISIGSGYCGCTLSYGNMELMEEASSSAAVCLRAVNPGTENIILSFATDEGIELERYTVIIDDELSVMMM